MASHKIEISVKAARAQISAAQRRSGGPGGIPVPGAPASAGRSNQDVRRLTMAIERSTKLERRTQSLMQRQNRLTERLIRQMRSLKTAMSSGGMGGGGGGGGYNLRSNIPVLGFVVSQLSNMFKLAVSAGRAAIGAVTQQSQTAGLGGFQYSGRETFRPSEVGQFEYERRMSRGRGRGLQEMGIGPGGDDQALALRYARFSGQDPSETGRTMGLMETQGGGFGRALARMQKEGLDVSQFRTVFQEMVPALEEAVAGGVSRSGLATAIIRQVATLSRYFPKGIGARAASDAVRNFTQLGAQAGKGRFDTLPGMLLMKASLRVAERPGSLKGITGEGGLFSGMQPGALRDLMKRDPITRQIVAMQLARDPESQIEMVRGIRKRFESSAVMRNIPKEAIDARMTRLAQGGGLLPGDMTLNQGAALFKMSRGVPGKVGAADIEKTKKSLVSGGGLRSALSAGVEKEQQLITVAAKFMPGVRTLDEAMMKLAERGSELAPAFNKLTIAGNKLIGALDGLLKILGGSEILQAAGRRFSSPVGRVQDVPKNAAESGRVLIRKVKDAGRNLGIGGP